MKCHSSNQSTFSYIQRVYLRLLYRSEGTCGTFNMNSDFLSAKWKKNFFETL